jgi:predicted GTPase
MSPTRPPTRLPNVIVFGETGAGKSSLVNMLDGGGQAIVSSGALGATFCSTPYKKTINGSAFRIFDTAGLNEAPGGTVPPRIAVDNLRRLIRDLEGGINLLVYVMRGPRIKASARQNYKMFFEGFCRKMVPIVIVITGLEERDDMSQWWVENKANFDRYKMSFNGVACIAATKGKLRVNGTHTYEVEYEESKKRLEDLIFRQYSRTAWKMSAKSWFVVAASTMRDVCTAALGFEREALVHELNKALEYDGIPTISPDSPPVRESTPNVIVFSETGAGKSSILNMLEGDTRAVVSDRAVGVTFNNKRYEKQIQGSTFHIFDTVGLNEGSAGTVSAKTAIEALYRLMHQLDDGVSLLVYVTRAPRITRTARKNYEMFFDIFCHRKVPIVVIVTGLENQTEMNQWWDKNEAAFLKRGFFFNGHACVTATRGKKMEDGSFAFGVEYEDSKWAVESLICRSCMDVPWKVPTKSWLGSVAISAYNVLAAAFGLEPKAIARELYKALHICGGFSREDAVREANKIVKQLSDPSVMRME